MTDPRRRLRRDRRGVAALEFALLIPFMMIMFVATTEAVSYLRTWYRVEQAAASAASAGGRIEALNTTAVAGLFEAARAVAAPYSAWTTGTALPRARTVVSVVSNPSNGNVVAWTCARGDATLLPRVAGMALLPGGFVVPRGQSVMVVEVINNTAPWVIMSAAAFFGNEGPRPMHAFVIVRPRATELTNLAGGCPA